MIKKTIILYYCLIITIITLQSCNKAQLVIGQNNLNFEKSGTIIPWISGCFVSDDTTLFCSGKQSAKLIFNKQDLRWLNKIATPISLIKQQFQLPPNTKSIKFSIYCISPSCKIHLEMSGFNNKNERLVDESISLDIPNTNWERLNIKKDIPTDVSQILIQITALQTEQANQVKGNKLSVWFDNAEFLCNNTSIEEYTFTPVEPFSKEELKQRVSLDENNFSKIDLYSQKRIIGLGETVHGSSTVNNFVFENLKYLVEFQHVKLLTFELHYDIVMCWNSFVNPTSNDSLTYLIPDDALLNTKALGNFLIWLKEYNRQHKTNIILVGLDGTSPFLPDDYILRFLDNLQAGKTTNELKKLYYDNSIWHPEIVYDFARTNKIILQNEIGCVNFKLLLRTLFLKNNKNNRILPKINQFEVRDYFMAQNAIYAIDSLVKPTDKIAMYSHLGHLAKIGNIVSYNSNNSMGRYLTEKYKNDYAVIGISVAQGENVCKNYSKQTFEVLELQKPALGSVESISEQQDENITYIRLKEKNNKLVTMRHIGFFNIGSQFFKFPFRIQMDGIVSIKNSIPIDISEMNNNKDKISNDVKSKQLRTKIYLEKVLNR